MSSRENVLIVSAREAYGFYGRAAIYCCPTTYKPIPDVDRIGFYASGIMPEVPELLGVVDDVDPLLIGRYASQLSRLGADVPTVESVLQDWQRAFPERRDMARARVAVLSASSSPRTVRLPRPITTQHGDAGIQSRAYFALDDLEAARTLSELRRLRDQRRGAIRR